MGIAGQKVLIYKDVARTQLVAEGAGNFETRITITEKNGSGIAGAVFVAGDPEIDHKFKLLCRPDFQHRLRDQFSKETEEDLKILQSALAGISGLADSFTAILSAWQSMIETDFILNYLKTKLKTTETEVLRTTQSQTAEEITISYSGLLQELKKSMIDDTVPQTVRKSTATASAVIADPDNAGLGSLSIVMLEHAKPGRVTLECVDETIGAEAFSLAFSPDEWWEFDDLTGFYNAIIKQTYRDNSIGISSMIIARLIQDVDPSNKYSTWVIAGENSTNMPDGKLYGKYSFATKITSFYSNSARTNLVAISGPYTVPGSYNITELSDSGLSGSVTMASEPVNNYLIEVLLNPFKLGDRLTFTISKNATGLIQKYLGDNYNFSLPSANNLGDETIKDSFIRRG